VLPLAKAAAGGSEVLCADCSVPPIFSACVGAVLAGSVLGLRARSAHLCTGARMRPHTDVTSDSPAQSVSHVFAKPLWFCQSPFFFMPGLGWLYVFQASTARRSRTRLLAFLPMPSETLGSGT